MAPFSKLRPGFPAGLQVLLVDGDAASREQIAAQLAELAYQVEAFGSAREAATFLSQGQPSLDIVLAEASSVHVGDSDSQWLLSQAKSRELPLVVMSGSGSTDEVMKGIELGAVDYLEKPVSPTKLQNIWQHVVRKMISSASQEDKPTLSGKQQQQLQQPEKAPAEKVGSGPSSPRSSPASSIDHMASAVTGHSSKCSEVEACCSSENAKAKGVQRSADTSAESSKPSPASEKSGLTRTASTATRPRSKRSRDCNAGSATTRPPLAIRPDTTQTPPPASASGPTMLQPQTWQPGCMWAMPQPCMTPGIMGWQVGMPASFMPVSSSPLPCTSSATPPSKGTPAPPAISLPSMGSFASTMSSTMELDLPASLGPDLCASSPSFQGSDDSLQSDFTDMMLPNDLDLDLMFGDGVDGIVDGLDDCSLPPLADKPPIGLSLRKSQSLVNLINEHLQATASSGTDCGQPAMMCT